MRSSFKRIIALSLTAGMLVSCLAGCGAADPQASQEPQVSTAETDAIAEAASSLMHTHGSEQGKEETVYVIADANGSPTKTIVSAWLKNPE